MDWLSIGAVSIGPVLIAGVIVYAYVMTNLESIRENWIENRCNPIYMPFAGLIQPNTSTFENFQYCGNAMSQQVFSLALEPVHRMFGVFAGFVETIVGELGYFRNFISGIQTFITSFTAETFAKIHNTFGEVLSLLARVRDLSAKLMGSLGYTVTIAITTVNFITSLFEMLKTLLQAIVGIIFGLAILLMFVFPPLLFFFIPIGAAIGISYCFHPETPIVVKGQGRIPIGDVKVGDILESGARVTAVMVCVSEKIPLYVYDGGIVVSGTHLVREDGVWIYVSDSKKSVPYEGERPEFIICLNTTDHQIPIKGHIFADYEEIEEPPSYESLEPTDTVFTPFGCVKLQNLRPGTPTLDGRVMAVVYLENNKMQVFMGNADGYFYINGGTRRVRDYPDSHSSEELEQIQERVLAELNKKSSE
jgi:hypothetical protein